MANKELITGEEVKDTSTLSRIKWVDEMLPKPANENQRTSGRPKLSEEHFRIVEECLKLDCTIEEACIYAGITPTTYYNHRKQDPDFALRMDRARDFPKMVARAAVQKRIRQWDAKTALRYLELRDRKRYTTNENIANMWEEWEMGKAPVVQFISVASNEWQNTTSPDSQSDTKPKSAYEWSANSWERQTPWENEEEALKRLDSLSSSIG